MISGPGDQAWRSTYKTLRSVFPEVRAYLASDTTQGLGNVVFFCSDSPLPPVVPKAARPSIRKNIESMLARELKPAPGSLDDAMVMDDDHAPLEYLLADSNARWRRNLQQMIPSVLLY